ncbi:protein NUCLEAR FUSION DEFECTIVE 4-like isoform X2 [Diospyros lotus]|uniref:protein NUCLEAR FUSION DEFECTIVE 4-like isoform X2 n=1 Tax=Diospyros lotus TaxID=55363 RepID=UPI0022504244|nr:protein NUCLEAR FUSION DEFECTIVE 4-like isoform X2 [Diospyros lotus]
MDNAIRPEVVYITIGLKLDWVFLLCLLAGCSICWFNTVCFILCNRNFPSNRPLAISLTVSFNGVSAALYALAANAIDPSSQPLYLLLNAVVPLITSFAALVPIIRQPPVEPLPLPAIRRDSVIFLILNLIAIATGVYLVLLSSSDKACARLLFAGAVFLLVLPLGIPGVLYAREWFFLQTHSSFRLEGSGFLLVDVEDLELHKALISRQSSLADEVNRLIDSDNSITRQDTGSNYSGCCETIMAKDRLVMLGEEHSAEKLVRRVDFWLYYVAYFCGGTIGLVYSNNLGQIAQSLGQGSKTSTLITLYSSFSFFGRLLSAGPDFLRVKVYFARTGWLTIALLPTTIAFFLLAAFGSAAVLHLGTALVGLSSGFIFAAAVSVTSELFGPNSVGVNHNILITNIPMGSLLYGLLAAIVYDANISGVRNWASTETVCIGERCYFLTFLCWGCISVVGLAASTLLFLRTRPVYDRFEKDRRSTLSSFN